MRVLALCALAALCAFVPGPAMANMGVPMIFITMPMMLAALVPIIAVEAFILARALGLRAKSAALVSLAGNAVSTLVGVPLSWIALVFVQMSTGGGAAHGTSTVLGKIVSVTWQAPWLIPYEEHLHWMIPAAQAVLLVPFFFASFWIEYGVARLMRRDLDPRPMRGAVWRANLVSYACLAVLVLGGLAWALLVGQA